ncbi:Hypothetical predicted protein [Pelobates cultripes]|uniref:Uncharacterized protein n=1 Tax=Pelobates cultripes TaxID=61616 RepID=A0AAD1WI36_PELCU|nr:Hypothetical predicted protein [Pelobates cultripes]
MKLIISLAFAVGILAVASALTCRICEFSLGSFCVTGSSTKNCTQSCSTIKTYAGSHYLFSKWQCDPNCNATAKIQTDHILKIDYTVSCCNTTECNSGNHVQLSLSLGVGMVLLWLLKAL